MGVTDFEHGMAIQWQEKVYTINNGGNMPGAFHESGGLVPKG